MKTVEFKVFRGAADLPNGRVAALRVPGGGTMSRKEIDDYGPFVAIYGAKGLAWIKVNDAQRSRTRKACSRRSSSSCPSPCCARSSTRTGAQDGDVIFFGADREKVVNDAMGALRAKIGHDRGFAEKGWKPLWVVDFPMFEYDEETEELGRPPPPVHRTEGRPRGALRDRSGARAGEGLRRRAERLGDRRRLGADPPPGRAGEGVRGAVDLARGPAPQVRLPARRAVLRRAAARRHRLRPRPHRDDDGGRRLDSRRDRVPEDAARAGSAGRRARARRPNRNCATCTSACAPATPRRPADAPRGGDPHPHWYTAGHGHRRATCAASSRPSRSA